MNENKNDLIYTETDSIFMITPEGGQQGKNLFTTINGDSTADKMALYRAVSSGVQSHVKELTGVFTVRSITVQGRKTTVKETGEVIEFLHSVIETDKGLFYSNGKVFASSLRSMLEVFGEPAGWDFTCRIETVTTTRGGQGHVLAPVM